ncbi:Uncharacterised protein [Mycobacterium tuberculosis]|nr:Uncharacterised protein [Mycobacterium tuberculosis]
MSVPSRLADAQMVITGTSVFLSAWPKWIARFDRPRARANLM